ncbi:MAG: Outer membrane protein P6 [Chlamydiae bacterium]|nr:Outer membrane protein P6 [Chlamydiota bacterium]
MKTLNSFIILSLFSILLTGCGCRSSQEVWDDTNSCGRYMGQGIRSLGGKHGDSRQVRCREDFCRPQMYGYQEEDFVPLQDEHGQDLICMEATQQPKISPGDAGSSIPGIESFRDPDHDPMLSTVFEHVHFPYDSEKILGQDNMHKIQNIAEYMDRHPNAYVFIEGHCDERGPQAYNLALGTRRANGVRSILIAEGVDSQRLFTVSYGKEQPLVFGHDEAAWTLNRRAQFKVYVR